MEKTKSGFTFSLSEDVRDDMELLESFIEIDQGNTNALPKLLIALLGEKQKKDLYEHCRSKKTGRVSAKKVISELKEILDTVNSDTKN